MKIIGLTGRKFIDDWGGQIWHIERPSIIPVESHFSEAGIEKKPGDITIRNDNSIEWLHEAIRQAMEK